MSGCTILLPMLTILFGQLYEYRKVAPNGSLLSKVTPRDEPGGRRPGDSLWGGLPSGVAEWFLECGRARMLSMVISKVVL